MPPDPAVRNPTAAKQAPDAASSARATRSAIEFKGLSYPALRAVLHDASPDALRHSLIDLLDGDPDRFEWQPVVVDLSRLPDRAEVDWQEVLAVLRAVRLHPVAVAGAPEGFRDEANRLQMGWLPAMREPQRRDTPQAAGVAPEAAAPAAKAGPGPQGVAAGAPADADAATPAPAGTMVVERPVRSGQRIYARDADLVVIGPVSPGAEVIADGNVHVYGALQGRAIAGARGRRDAAIFTLDLRAELVAVCGVYRTFEEGPPAEHLGRPVRIELDAVADRLSVRPL